MLCFLQQEPCLAWPLLPPRPQALPSPFTRHSPQYQINSASLAACAVSCLTSLHVYSQDFSYLSILQTQHTGQLPCEDCPDVHANLHYAPRSPGESERCPCDGLDRPHISATASIALMGNHLYRRASLAVCEAPESKDLITFISEFVTPA